GKQNGIPVIFNPAPATDQLDFHYVTMCDYVLPNETELELMTGMPVETEVQAHEAAYQLVEKGVRNVIVTLGSRGVLWMTKEQSRRYGAFTIEAVDTTGAGDAFIGC